MSVADIAYGTRMLGIAQDEAVQEAGINAGYYQRFAGTGMSTSARKMALMQLGAKVGQARQDASDYYAVLKAQEAADLAEQERQEKLAAEANKKNSFLDFLGGAASGAAAGSAFGPWGALIGGTVGGVGSLL